MKRRNTLKVSVFILLTTFDRLKVCGSFNVADLSRRNHVEQSLIIDLLCDGLKGALTGLLTQL